MGRGALRGFVVLFSAFALIGASWSPLRAPGSGGFSGVDRLGAPFVYVRLPSWVPLPDLTQSSNMKQVAIGPEPGHATTLPTQGIPALKTVRFGQHKSWERLVLDFSDRVDFWYWTQKHQDTLTIEFPQLRLPEKNRFRHAKSRLVTATRLVKNSQGTGGKIAIGLAEKTRLKRIFLLPPTKSGGHRLVVDFAPTQPKVTPSPGTGMAWGGGKHLNRIGPVLLAKMYGRESIRNSAVKSDETAGEVGAENAVADKPAQVATPAVVRQPSTDIPTFDPLWPRKVDDEETKNRAQELAENLEHLATTHERIKAARADLEAVRQTLLATSKAGMPTLDITAFYGYEHQNKPSGSADTSMPPREIDFSLTQLLTDFGADLEEEYQAELAVAQAEAILQAVTQSVMLEALSAHYQLASARQALRYARLSEQNIKRQTDLEDARVRRGSGLATDVLQAKAQLAGASARRVRAEGAYELAKHRYVAVFGKLPDNPANILYLPVPDEALPPTLPGSIDIALKTNPQLEVGRIVSETARAETRRTEASGYYPELNLIAESKWKRDAEGTIGPRDEHIIRVELTFPFNLGGAAVDTVEAAKNAFIASEKRLEEARVLIQEQVRTAWQQYESARLTAEQLRNQAELAAEFLDLARKERKLGKRSLIEVLSGETALANARSDAVAARNNQAIAAFTLLSTMGTLDPDSLI